MYVRYAKHHLFIFVIFCLILQYVKSFRVQIIDSEMSSYSTAPALCLPMDEIPNATLKGSIRGSIVGGAVLIPGKLKNALSTNGIKQAVTLGKHLDKCFHIPDACGMGSTFSYWLKWWGSVPGHRVIMDSGSYCSGGRCYAHIVTTDEFMAVHVKDSSHYYKIKVSVNEPEKNGPSLHKHGPYRLESNFMSMVAFCWLTLNVLLEGAASSGTTTSSLVRIVRSRHRYADGSPWRWTTSWPGMKNSQRTMYGDFMHRQGSCRQHAEIRGSEPFHCWHLKNVSHGALLA